MYAILESDWYPKTKRRIRDIEAVNHAGYELIKADVLALFAELDGLSTTSTLTDAEMSQELHDPLQARLEHRPRAERLSECRQAIVVLAKEIAEIEKEDKPQVRVDMAESIQRRNGRR
jgi:hypothetical protein